MMSSFAQILHPATASADEQGEPDEPAGEDRLDFWIELPKGYFPLPVENIDEAFFRFAMVKWPVSRPPTASRTFGLARSQASAPTPAPIATAPAIASIGGGVHSAISPATAEMVESTE